MNLSDEINAIKKEVAIRKNKSKKILAIVLLCNSGLQFWIIFLCHLIDLHAFDPFFYFFGITFGVIAMYYLIITKISIDEDSINTWFLSLPGDDRNVKDVDKEIIERWNKPREKIWLKTYQIINKGDKKILSFIHNDTNYNLPLHHIKYDVGEKRIEFYVSDNDYTSNICKGTWFDIDVYNV